MLRPVLPKTIRGKIILYTTAVTCSIAIFTVAVCSFVFQSLLKRNQIQSAEYSLRIICDNTAGDLENILSFYRWCSFNTDIAAYLDAFQDQTRMPGISEKNSGLRSVALHTYERLKEEYYNTHSSEYISRILLSPLNSCSYMQICDTTSTVTGISVQELTKETWFQEIFGDGNLDRSALMEDPFLPGNGSLILPAAAPVSGRYRSSQAGWIYMSISDRLILDYLKSFPMEKDSALYLTIAGQTWLYEDDSLHPFTPSFEVTDTLKDHAFHSKTTVSTVRPLQGGRERTLISCPIGDYGWSVSLLLSQSFMEAQSALYILILLGIAVFILLVGLFLLFLLNRSIGCPVHLLKERIQAVAGGDFSPDPSIQWENEFGDIGRGINRMSADLSALIGKRIQDEKERRDLEYRILQSQINPHFLYNTLNSIKWMASIQGASGISEMTTALARLLKSISKGAHTRITLREELALVKDYFLIQQYRYGGSITLSCVADESLYQCLIHRFTLQPLVETALFHGIEPKGCVGKIEITARSETDPSGRGLLLVQVRDNGVGMDKDTIKKVLAGNEKPSADFFRQVGISNVNQRIRYDCGPEYGISIKSVPGEYTCMTITLPYETAQGEIL